MNAPSTLMDQHIALAAEALMSAAKEQLERAKAVQSRQEAAVKTGEEALKRLRAALDEANLAVEAAERVLELAKDSHAAVMESRSDLDADLTLAIARAKADWRFKIDPETAQPYRRWDKFLADELGELPIVSAMIRRRTAIFLGENGVSAGNVARMTQTSKPTAARWIAEGKAEAEGRPKPSKNPGRDKIGRSGSQ
jgi:hypothetical protein